MSYNIENLLQIEADDGELRTRAADELEKVGEPVVEPLSDLIRLNPSHPARGTAKCPLKNAPSRANYLDEFTFRSNRRSRSREAILQEVLTNVAETEHLTYDELTQRQAL